MPSLLLLSLQVMEEKKNTHTIFPAVTKPMKQTLTENRFRAIFFLL